MSNVVDSSVIDISRRGSLNPNVWWAILGVVPLVGFLLMLATSAMPPWASALLSLLAGVVAGGTIALVAHAFCRRGLVDSQGYTETMSFCGWQLWQEVYSADEIESLSLEGQCFSDTTEPYAHRIYLHLTSGAMLPSFVFVKQDQAERLRQQLIAALCCSKNQ